MASSKPLKDRIAAFVEQLALETDSAMSNQRLMDYLAFCARFHRYSLYNTCLIYSQFPEATRVAGYRRWQQMGRQVKKAEKGIAILAPIFTRRKDEDDDDRAIRGFMAVHVFDESQTEGADLPQDPMLTMGTCHEDLVGRLLGFAEAKGIQVVTGSVGGAYGSSAGGKITLDPKLVGADRFAVLVHEVAHEILHHGDNKPDRKTGEIQAETTAHIVCSHFGIPSAAPNYLFAQGATGDEIITQLNPLVNTIQTIIAALEEAPALQAANG